MCILGSRDHYCIHPKISLKQNKTQEWLFIFLKKIIIIYKK